MPIGATIGAYAANAAYGIGSALLSNHLAEEREKVARKENYEYGELAANAADLRTRKLYGDLQSPKALLQQYKEAGLSPSMMFANGANGTVGQGAQGSGPAGINPTTYGIPPMDLAQLGLIEAQTRKTNAEAETEEGTNEKGRAQINSIVESTKNTALKNAWQEYENALSSLNLGVKAAIADKEVENYYKQCEHLQYKVRSASVKADIDEKSKDNILSFLAKQVLQVQADISLKRSQAKLAEAQVELTNEQVQDLISQIYTREGTLDLNQEQLSKQVEQWGVENGFRKKEQWIAIGKIFADFESQGMDRGVRLLESLLPFANKTTKIKGL